MNREADPGRQELSPQRIAELLELVPRIYEREPAIGKFLFRPALPEESGKSAQLLLGRRVASVVAEMAGDVHAFVTDVFWLHAIAFRLRGGDTIDSHLQRAETLSTPDAWTPLRRNRREVIAEEVAGVARLLRRVGRSEEAAVAAVTDKVCAMFFRYRQIG